MCAGLTAGSAGRLSPGTATSPVGSTTASTTVPAVVSSGSAAASAACAGCAAVLTVPLAGGAHVDGLVRDSDHAGLLGYYSGGRWVVRGLSGATPRPDEVPTTAQCQTVRGVPRCAVTFTVGAHSAEAELFTVEAARGVTVTGSVTGDSPDAVLADLDGDGVLDVAVLISTYQPDYADAPMFWRTYTQRDGTFVPTGCGTPSHDRVAAPSVPLTGPCPS